MKRLLALALLALSSTVFAATLNPIQLLNPAGSTAGQAIVSTGASTAPAWGNVTATALVAQAANTVVANVTAGSASPTAVALPSCSTANSALKYTSATGFSCGTTYALTSGTLAQFAATTSAQLLGVISDETGSGALVFATGSAINPASTGATTPGTGAFTTLSASGLITPSSTVGIKGTATNDNAQAGSVGEFPAPTNLTGVSLTTGTAANVSSVSLPAGDYEVSGLVAYSPAGSTVLSTQISGINTTSATLGALGTYSQFTIGNTVQAGVGSVVPSPTVRISLASTTTVYLIAEGIFTTSTCTASGFLHVRRVR